MKFSTLAGYFERIEATTKRLEMFDILAELFSEAQPAEIRKIVYMSQGQMSPPFEGVEFGISSKLLTRTLSESSKLPTAEIEALYAETGDLGLVAGQVTSGGDGLTVEQVYDELSHVAATSGKGSQDQKINALSSLLKALSPLEARYVARFVLGKLRLGVGDPTVLEALAITAEDRALRPELERAYNLCSDLGLVAETLKHKGMEGIAQMGMTVGYPVRMALCERLPTSVDIINKMGRAAIEAKYDGIRCQLHKDGGRVEIFSRNLERMTHMFPEITAAALALPHDSLIMEGEALAFNEATGELLPFQTTMQRKRKHNIKGMSEEFPLKFFAFELLLVDGEDYTVKSYSDRRQALVSLIAQAGQAQTTIKPAVMFETSDPAEIDSHFEEFVETGLEGVVAKRLDSPYAAGARNFNWIKLKRSYRGELADTVDVCVVGYYLGRGHRARFGIGAILGAVYDHDSDTFKTVTKIGSGFTEDELRTLKTAMDDAAITHRHARVDSLMQPDVWVEPRYVITVTADEITRSPMHTAGMAAEGEHGYALRFPRATGDLRDDKAPEDANSVAEIIAMFNNQKTIKSR